MNILYITSYVPGEIKNGACQRSTNLYQALVELGHSVYTVIPVDSPQEEEIDQKHRIAKLSLYNPHTFSWFFNGLLRRTIGFIQYYSNGGMGKYDAVWENVSFDLTVCRYTQYAAMSQAWRIAPCILDIDDMPLEIFDTIIASKIRFPFFWRIFVNYWERWTWRHCAWLWVSNPSNLVKVQHPNVSVLPNIPMPFENEDSIGNAQQQYVLSVASWEYGPNNEGMDYFLTNVWNDFVKDYPNLQFHIVGAISKERSERWSKNKNVIILGYVDKLEVEYSSALFTVAPIYSGGGTSIKILESLSHSRICVSSRFAARGFENTSLLDNGLLISDSHKDYFKHMHWLLEHTDERLKLQNKANEAVHSMANFDVFKNSISQVLNNVVSLNR